MYNDNNRLEIVVLNRPSEVYTRYVDIPSTMNFLHRVGNVNNFSIIARKGEKAIFINRINVTEKELSKKLNDFAIQR